ncbi:MAG: hypothetical protein AAFQ15_11615, partial [Pseudomonadota bacterium]
PLFERSAYTFSWWCTWQRNGISDLYDGCSQPAYIFARITHSLQIASSRSGKYPDPLPAQDAAYQAAIETAVSRAIYATTQFFGGRVDGGIGVFPEGVQ